MSIHKAGTIVLFSNGEYSDYDYCGHVVTQHDCDFSALVEEFKAQYKPKAHYDTPEPGTFVAWLCAKQHVVEINCTEIHLGYGSLELRGY